MARYSSRARVKEAAKRAPLVQRFHNMTECLDFVSPPGAHWPQDNDKAYWSGFFGPTYGTARESALEWMRYVERGASEAEQAETRRVMEKIDAGMERRHAKFVPNVTGSRVCVPEVLTGHPLHMRRRVKAIKPSAPVRVYVECNASSSVSTSQLSIRGAAVAAFVMRLSESRAVELWASSSLVVGWQNVVMAVKLDTHPISIAQVCAAFVSAQFIRGIRLPVMAKLGQVNIREESFPWAWGYDKDFPKNTGPHYRNTREALHMEPQDVFITGCHTDNIDDIIRNPAQWVHDMLQSQRVEE